MNQKKHTHYIIASCIAFVLLGIVIFFLLRPDPLDLITVQNHTGTMKVYDAELVDWNDVDLSQLFNGESAFHKVDSPDATENSEPEIQTYKNEDGESITIEGSAIQYTKDQSVSDIYTIFSAIHPENYYYNLDEVPLEASAGLTRDDALVQAFDALERYGFSSADPFFIMLGSDDAIADTIEMLTTAVNENDDFDIDIPDSVDSFYYFCVPLLVDGVRVYGVPGYKDAGEDPYADVIVTENGVVSLTVFANYIIDENSGVETDIIPFKKSMKSSKNMLLSIEPDTSKLNAELFYTPFIDQQGECKMKPAWWVENEEGIFLDFAKACE